MYCRTYKNGNITIKHEPFFDGDVTDDFHVFPAWVAEHEDGFDTYSIDDFECWGNAYGAYPVEIFVNGELGIYCITPDDFERFRDGYTVRLYRRELAPLFVLPSFYKFVDGYELDGTKGTLYWLCDEPDAEKVEEMTSFGGCKMLNSRCQYAPEIKSKVVFVPNGTPFSFC